jgi:ribose 5-phosphate isomerase B
MTGKPGNEASNTEDKVLRVAVGSDHGGYKSKELLKSYLGSLGYRVVDVGCYSQDSVDYPDFARAALCYDLKTVRNSREHNNANVLTLGGPLHPPAELCEMAKVWLETRFAGGRHWPRINKMMAVERGSL